MIIEVLVNGKEMSFKKENMMFHQAITEIRTDLKKEFKKKKQQCELWFTDIKN